MGDKSAGVLLSSAYLAPIQYFTKMVSYESVLIDQCESYIKQSFRNRAVILTSNGPVHLSIPVVDGPRAKGLIRDIKLSYDHQWQQIHWRGITSAYNNSPFFEYYADELAKKMTLSISETLPILSLLEVRGVVGKDIDGKFIARV